MGHDSRWLLLRALRGDSGRYRTGSRVVLAHMADRDLRRGVRDHDTDHSLQCAQQGKGRHRQAEQGRLSLQRGSAPLQAFQHFSWSAFQHFSWSAFQHFSWSAFQLSRVHDLADLLTCAGFGRIQPFQNPLHGFIWKGNSATCSVAWAARRSIGSVKWSPMSWTPTGSPSERPPGTLMAGMPARLAGTAHMSLAYMARGSSTFSPILNATEGAVGESRTS